MDGDLEQRLQRFLTAHGRVERLEPMADGHAGLTFGFDLIDANSARRRYILKKSPQGVPRKGSTDVFRQAALLRALSASGFAAPNVPWASENEDALGAPFIVMERLRGRSFIPWDPAPALLAQFDDPQTLWTATARLMGALHAFDWRAHLADWEAPTDLGQELERWSRLLRHMQDETHLALAQQVQALLARALPAGAAVGLTHGDLQPGNVLFDEGAAQALIDWDLAAIGPLGLDVGWLLMMGDAEAWPPQWRPKHAPGRAVLLDAYAKAGGARMDDLDWFQAFSQFRMAAITGLNLKLHRDGRRHDPIWENFSAAVPSLLTGARALLRHAEDDAP